MIFIRYNGGSLGHFLGSVLSNQTSNFNNLDYGQGIKNCLHTGGYNEEKFDIVRKKMLDNDIKICTHNSPFFDELVENFRTDNNSFIFIDLNSHFVEYRLNYIAKIPVYNNFLNQLAKITWKDFKFPIICDDARRIIRLHQNKEQAIKFKTGDFKFCFESFYDKDKDSWKNTFTKMFNSLKINNNIDLDRWFNDFQNTQKEIIFKAEKIYNCIKNRKYTDGLSDNEKGIIVGYIAQQENLDDGHSFEEIHKKLSL